jgi:hypothetical protein
MAHYRHSNSPQSDDLDKHNSIHDLIDIEKTYLIIKLVYIFLYYSPDFMFNWIVYFVHSIRTNGKKWDNSSFGIYIEAYLRFYDHVKKDRELGIIRSISFTRLQKCILCLPVIVSVVIEHMLIGPYLRMKMDL